MGIGMVVVCAAGDVDAVQAAIAEPTWVIGELVRRRAARCTCESVGTGGGLR